MQSIVLAGSTGLIGQAVIKQLVHYPMSATLLSRKPLQAPSSDIEVIITDFEHITLPKANSAKDAVLCALGTTIKSAGSKAAFAAVDYDLVKRLAHASNQAGYQHFIVISSLGTRPKTKSFYLQTKAKMEAALIDIEFKSLSILRPSLLLGKRNEFRLGEKTAELVSKILAPVFRGKLSRYQPIEADLVAKTMLELGLNPSEGVRVLESEEIRVLAKQSS